MRQDSAINQVDVHREDFPSERNGFDEFLDTVSHEVEKLEETKEVSKKTAKQDNEPTRAIFYRSFSELPCSI